MMDPMWTFSAQLYDHMKVLQAQSGVLHTDSGDSVWIMVLPSS